MYLLKNVFHQVFAQYPETEFSNLQLVLCRWVTYEVCYIQGWCILFIIMFGPESSTNISMFLKFTYVVVL